MTKTIKLSLAAAMVAGIATTASAQSLTDAIQNVDVSGYVDYRLENKSIDNNSAESYDVNEYAVNVTLTSKVNDMVKATVSAGFDEARIDNTNADSTKGGLDKDTDPSIAVSNAYFTFDLGATTVMAGKQAIPSAFVDTKDTAKTGTGVVALVKANDSLTVAAAHFMSNNIVKESKTSELVAMGKAGVVSYQVNYNKTDRTDNQTETDRMFVKLSGNVAGLKVSAQHATASADATYGDTTKYDDSTVSAVSVAGKAGAVALSGTYFTADIADQNTASDVAIDSDNDSASNVKVWQLSTDAITKEGNGFALTAGMPVASNVSAKLVYAAATDEKASSSKDIDYTETMAMVTYKMSKNFTMHARYSVLTKEVAGSADVDTALSRVQVKYSF